jgi:D-lactate dehydrogenase (cytochrome)
MVILRDPDVLASFLEDAAHFTGGHAAGLATPSSVAEVAALVRAERSVLPIGAQSSLTGGATPMGDVLLSTAKLNRILDIGERSARVEAGVSLIDLDEALARAGRYYPPTPTFMGATAGGIVATNAAGAATFKYGTTRDWVEALTVVLASGDVLRIERGTTIADANGGLSLPVGGRTVRIAAPHYRLPAVAKVSAGYFSSPTLDLIDLFIGSEGTLGVVTDVTLRVVPRRPALCLMFVPFADRRRALAFVASMRAAARETWRTGDPRGVDISAIEHMDARCLALLRECGADERFGVRIPASSSIALLITLELPPETRSADAFDELGRIGELDTPLTRLARALDAAQVLEDVEIAAPGDAARAAQLLALREEVPALVNARVGLAKQTVDPRIAKTAADMIVPFDRLDALMTVYDEEFARRGLDAAVWGHISDGNLHPNVIPRSIADVESGKEAILAFGREVLRMGGSPLAEHGVGRNPIKQRLLLEMYGPEGVEEMRAIKRVFDPEWKLAAGVLFPQVR